MQAWLLELSGNKDDKGQMKETPIRDYEVDFEAEKSNKQRNNS